ncbi:MAG: DOMON-like domain-containing protein [Deltaproteobacteria bacterium]|nr:DOMON-like domain-containing protein [Deltaproteobacteria bacterium]
MREQKFSLTAFPAAGPLPEFTLSGGIARRGHVLTLRYDLHGRLADIAIPRLMKNPGRRQGLWEDTCFELFLVLKGSPQYWEFNLSPAGHWNVYQFVDYRRGMQEEPAFASLPFSIRRGRGAWRLTLEADLRGIIPPGQELEAGVSAVIKLRDGRQTYWALTHCAPEPDFHRRDSFLLTL